ncbi:probable WRKY transcription factor 54 [Hordeum vulgare subsp. vulgare]|uniref:WRKY domain-containing protein n=1 Tax=Hordeum vulgare subsp. vulgare TaxID=112509 RepID=A0A8I6YQQ0_HORVV|nr:probable WRKY transcription factor 54 [Hordeum vulgare subsp. vulgare]KAI4991636.1 hypothetical protein ZWY2020_040022 [Hordeum vulgare]
MQRSRGCAPGGEHGWAAADGGGMQLQRRERELVAQLHELLYPSTSPSRSGASSCSGLAAELYWEHGSSQVKATASCGGGKRRGGRKRAREDERHEEGQGQRAGAATATKATTRCRRKKLGTTTRTLVTTVPDFDGYQWRKYGQKQIEAAMHPRSYYRCTNSTNQGCPAKRTVQRNDDDGNDNGRPKYTVVYISEHSCKSTESAAVPVILETTVRADTAAAPDVDVVPGSSSSAISSETQSPASSSDLTWSSGGSEDGANPPPRARDDYSRLFAIEDECWWWNPSPAPAVAPALLQEMDFDGPIRSPVHVAAADGSWINDLFVNEPPFVLNSCHLFAL